MDIKRVSPHEAHSLVENDGYVHIDVRSVPEFVNGHPKGSYNVPLMHMEAGGMTPNQDFMRVMNANFAKDVPMVMGCRSGNRSLKAAAMLIEAGWSVVVDQRAGFDGPKGTFGETTDPGWRPSLLPVAVDPDEGRSYEALLAKANANT